MKISFPVLSRRSGSDGAKRGEDDGGGRIQSICSLAGLVVIQVLTDSLASCAGMAQSANIQDTRTSLNCMEIWWGGVLFVVVFFISACLPNLNLLSWVDPQKICNCGEKVLFSDVFFFLRVGGWFPGALQRQSLPGIFLYLFIFGQKFEARILDRWVMLNCEGFKF